jgi:hypothetical protein|tara:strand:- start:3327 stop:3599 length:273 start_codon:yes stop_codon:yes gene_type:complete
VSEKKTNLVDLGFMDARIKLIDIAAFLDRIDRHDQSDDYRVSALKGAFPELLSSETGRAARVLDLLSDQSTEPVSESNMQGAFGAPSPDQ